MNAAGDPCPYLCTAPSGLGVRSSRSAPMLRSPLSALGSAPGAPRWPLPVMSRSQPDLLARLPLPGPSDLVPDRRAAPAGELRCPAGRTFSAQVGAHPAHSRTPPGSAFPSGPLGRREGTRPRRAHTLRGRLRGGAGSGEPTRAILPAAGMPAHCPEEETEAGGRDVPRAPPASRASAPLPLAFLEGQLGEKGGDNLALPPRLP